MHLLLLCLDSVLVHKTVNLVKEKKRGTLYRHTCTHEGSWSTLQSKTQNTSITNEKYRTGCRRYTKTITLSLCRDQNVLEAARGQAASWRDHTTKLPWGFQQVAWSQLSHQTAKWSSKEAICLQPELKGGLANRNYIPTEAAGWHIASSNPHIKHITVHAIQQHAVRWGRDYTNISKRPNCAMISFIEINYMNFTKQHVVRFIYSFNKNKELLYFFLIINTQKNNVSSDAPETAAFGSPWKGGTDSFYSHTWIILPIPAPY